MATHVTLRVLIVDDEAPSRRRIARLLEEAGDVEVVAACSGGEEAVEAIASLAPDLVFLDIQMPEMDGFEVLEAVGPDRLPAVVFVTAYDQYALQAFDAHALDYLLKPFSEERFRESLHRVRRLIRMPGAGEDDRLRRLLAELRNEGMEPAGRGSGHLDRFLVKQEGKLFFVPVAEVVWLSAEGNYVSLHTRGKTYLIRSTLANLDGRLDPRTFTRIHRSTIVRTDQIKEVRPWFSGDYMVHLADGTELKMSRRYSDRLFEQGR
ncbi:MAG TPA: LytTR family DNA-binding domain-containing protein [Longimicrobiaceae bacterium]|nr:LytTR family DNA-binding domain-containing protein [Longimicrobiaceae bacterium]